MLSAAPRIFRTRRRVGPAHLIELHGRGVGLIDESPESDLDARHDRPPSRILREGDRATVFAWGDALLPALAAADACAAANPAIAVTVIELCRLAPLEFGPDPSNHLVMAARATGKVVIAHAGPRTHGLGAELAAHFADRAILQLDAPIRRICGESTLLDGSEEHRASPSAAAIVEAIVDVVHF
jgi:pyruvate/2-oxoglutarate/acetoin dehydrogenase E1 component